jgi:hypothetical protein
MYTNNGIELPGHLRKLLTTYQWGPFGNHDKCCVAAVSEEIFLGELFDVAGETFCVVDVGEVEVTAANVVTKLTQRFSDKSLVATAINAKAM